MNHRSYWRYQFLKDFPLLAILLVVEILLAIFSLLTNLDADSYKLTFAYVFIAGISLIAYFFPLAHKAKLYNRRSVDLYLSLPLDKKGIYIADLLLGLSELFVLFLIYYAFGLIFSTMSYHHEVFSSAGAGYLFAYGLMALITAYTLSEGIIATANNAFDAVLFLILFALAEVALTYEIAEAIPSTCYMSSSSPCPDTVDFAFAPLSFFRALEDHGIDTYHVDHNDPLPDFVPIIHLMSGLVSALIGFVLSSKWKAENAAQPTKVWYGYPLFTSLAFAFLIGYGFPYYFQKINGWTLALSLFGVGTLLYLILIFVGQRKIRLHWRDVFFYLGSVGFGYLLAYLINLNTGLY